jgi:hypothetical protein
VTEEVEVERWYRPPVKLTPEIFNLPPYIVRGQHRAGDGPETTGTGDRSGKPGTLDASHRRLDDGQADIEQSGQVHAGISIKRDRRMGIVQMKPAIAS